MRRSGTRLLGALCCVLAAPLLRAAELDIPVFEGSYGLGFYTETARQFEALRPGVTINLYGNPRIHDQVRVRIIDGHFPDAASMGYILWPALIRAGKVLDLTPYLDGPNWEGDARWRDTFQPGSLDSWRMGGRTYGLPFTYACWTLFYNRGLFRAHGWAQPRTWDEFFALCDRIRAAGIAPLSLPGTRWLYPDAFLRAAYHNLAGPEGWRALDALAPGAWLDPRLVRSAALLQRIAREDAHRGWEGQTAPGAELEFLEGRSAMTVSGSWLVGEMQGKIPAGFDLGAMNFPVFPEGAADPTTIHTGSDCFFVFATGNAERERLTVDFLRFLTSRARAEAFVRQTDAPVAVRGVPASAYGPRMQDTVAMIAGARDAFNMPQEMMQPAAIRQALVDDTTKLMYGRISPEEYARRMETAADAERKKSSDPERVEYRHAVAGAALLASLAGVAGWFLFRAFRDRGGRSRPAGAPAGSFGRLSGPMAAGFVGPAMALYAALMLAPAAAAFVWAFTRWDGISPQTWAGLFNFKRVLFESDDFWAALNNNLFLVAAPALFVMPIALFLALMIHRGVWGAGVFRVVLLFPNLLGGIAATLLWLNAYEPHGGLVNAGLAGLGRALHSGWLSSFEDFPWLSESHLYLALIPIYIWMACGFNLILYLAAMEGIDPQLYEAAEIDGMPEWRQFFIITLPLIREVVAISAVFLVIAGLNAFEMVWLLTSQQPTSAVQTLGTLLVTTMFKYMDIGQAAALAVVLFLLVAAACALLWRGMRREIVE